MGGSDGVEADRFQLLHLPCLRVVEAHRADHAVVVMQAAALQLDDFAIDAQAVLHIRLNGPDAEQHLRLIHGWTVGRDDVRLVGTRVLHPRHQPIQVRRFGAPQLRIVHGQGHMRRRFRHRRHLGQRL